MVDCWRFVEGIVLQGTSEPDSPPFRAYSEDVDTTAYAVKAVETWQLNRSGQVNESKGTERKECRL